MCKAPYVMHFLVTRKVGPGPQTNNLQITSWSEMRSANERTLPLPSGSRHAGPRSVNGKHGRGVQWWGEPAVTRVC